MVKILTAVGLHALSVFSGIPCRFTDQVCTLSRPVQQLSYQVILHFEHPDHSPERPRFQLVCYFANARCQVQRKLFHQSSRCLGRE